MLSYSTWITLRNVSYLPKEYYWAIFENKRELNHRVNTVKTDYRIEVIHTTKNNPTVMFIENKY